MRPNEGASAVKLRWHTRPTPYFHRIPWEFAQFGSRLSQGRRAIISEASVMCQNALPSHIVDARLTFPRKNAIPARDHLMKFDITSFQAVAANLAVEGEVCDLAHAKLSTPTETDLEIAPLIDKVGATSIAEVDRLIAELQDARNYLISEGERIERETVRYANLTLMASATTKIISDAISQWHPASNQQNASEVMAASTEDDIGAFRKSRHHRQSDTSELCQEADATEGTPTHAKV
jgi:hypothetical protein